ncbi:thermostable hemolysin [Brumicola nitratireducens]|uniref:Thermostable hemolysin n=1 Tax=Glaciecola nitratireducens (strain JCM 12485 / KCTC 12276 / FR1064) TaxID=1085623 RepID=G4QJ02_GLANF|nr:thermostable hemolysin [Glaciecola nitratireducens]AEP28341.1 thermostable hemolysin [Glaciecola nitratireducens FR1064]
MQAVDITLPTDLKGTESFTSQLTNKVCRSAQASDAKYTFSLDVYQKHDDGRAASEQFIKDGFASAYGADIEISMPYVLAINNGKFKAALGIRSAKESLFVEQYLAQPIEHYVSQAHDRRYIAEIGHLYSNSNKFTIPLFLTTAVSLFCNGYEHMVFAGTEHVVKLISKAGIDCHYIAQADKNKLQESSINWGTYYETNPQVVFVSLAAVMLAVNKSAHFKQMFDQLERKIALTTRKLKR